MRGPTLARRHATNHLRPISNRLLGMKRPVVAGDALANDFCVRVDEDGHEVKCFRQLLLKGLITVTDPYFC